MKKQIRIGDRVIGDRQPLFVIAEIGVTCNYDIAIAKQLIDITAEAGADAVKFIFWFPDEIMADRTITYSYDTVDGRRTENMFEMLSKLRFSLDQWREVKAHADRRGVVMLSTVNSPTGIEWAQALDLQAFKLSSWDYNYVPLLRRIATLRKPMLLDTGPVDTLDVARVMKLMTDAGNDESVLVHCFHTENPDEMNMRAIPYMRAAFDSLVGFSATGLPDEEDVMAVTLGACVLEKRLTLDRALPGHHHVLSKQPDEFHGYVKTVRTVHRMLGAGPLCPSAVDLAERRKWFRHLVANEDIPAGTVLSSAMIEGKRGEGVSPEYVDQFVGRTTKRALRRNESLSWSDV
jgi:sialic acid synthase SpsE